MLHIVGMTLTRRSRRRCWCCCIGFKCSSTVLPAGDYTMYVGLGCLSATTVGATNNETDTSIVNTSSYASHQQIHYMLLEYTLCIYISGKHKIVAIKKLDFLFCFSLFWVVNLVQYSRFRAAITFFFGITAFLYPAQNSRAPWWFTGDSFVLPWLMEPNRA